MTTKHKWYNEIVAWAEGKTVQCRRDDTFEWSDITNPNPYWGQNWQYRVKPEPRTFYMVEYRVGAGHWHPLMGGEFGPPICTSLKEAEFTLANARRQHILTDYRITEVTEVLPT